MTWDSSEGETLALTWSGVYDVRPVGRKWFAIPLEYAGPPLYAGTVRELGAKIDDAERERLLRSAPIAPKASARANGDQG